MTISDDQRREIAEARKNIHLSSRAYSSDLEQMLHEPIPVLDHGFVRVVDYMGNDEAIVQAARVSYGSGTKAISTDRGLIRYLMRHWHSTPFEMCEIKLHVKLPVFVARQWVRHRTANVNEYSARYSILENEFYIPRPEHVAMQSQQNNQGRGDLIDDPAAVIQEIEHQSAIAYESYDWLIGDPTAEDGGLGVARELGRMVLPTNIYTQWYWKVDLHNLFHFLRLRADPHAQLEIRAYAEAICQIVKAWVPLAYEAFEDYRLNAVSFSAQEMLFLRKMLPKEVVEQFWCDPNSLLSNPEHEANNLLSAREAREFLAKLRGSD